MPGKKVPTQLNQVISKLGEKYSAQIPTATELRKALGVGETSPRTQALLTQQMRHSVEVHKRTYEQLKMGTHAPKA